MPNLSRRSLLATGGSLGLTGLAFRHARAAEALAPLSFQLSWIKSIQYGGYFGGLEIGSFKDAGLDVTFVSGGPNIDPVANVAAGRAQLGDRPSGPLIIARDKGIPIKIIGTVFRRSPYGVISLASKPIRTVQDMVGKTISVPTAGQPLVNYLLVARGIDPSKVNIVPASPDPAGIVSGEIDGYAGYSTNQGVMLQTRGVDIAFLSGQDNGLPDATGVIYAREDFLAAHRPEVVAFLRGAIKGWAWTLAHPDETAHLMVEKYGAPGLKYAAQHTEILASKPFIDPPPSDTAHLLSVDMDLFANMIDVYRKVKMITSDMKVTDLCDPSFVAEAQKPV